VYIRRERDFDLGKKEIIVDPKVHSKLIRYFLKISMNNLYGAHGLYGLTYVEPPVELTLKNALSYYFGVYCDYAFYDTAFYDTMHLLTQIQSNRKQYFMTFTGVNRTFFNTISSGKLMASLGVKLKSAKKSKKTLKYLVDYFEYYYLKKFIRVTHYLLKPTNRKNLNMFYEIQKYCKIDRGFLGGRLYYKSITKRAARIKKRVKSRLLASCAFYA